MRMYKPNIQHLAFVDRPASGVDWDLTKAKDGIMAFRAWHPFLKAADDGQTVTVGGVAYPCGDPTKEDLQGDWAAAEDVVGMQKSFQANGLLLNLMHKIDLRPEQAQVTISEIRKNGDWYVEAKVFDPELVAGIRGGKLKAWSVGGTCVRIGKSAVSADDQAELAFYDECLPQAKELLALLAGDAPSAQNLRADDAISAGMVAVLEIAQLLPSMSDYDAAYALAVVEEIGNDINTLLEE